MGCPARMTSYDLIAGQRGPAKGTNLMRHHPTTFWTLPPILMILIKAELGIFFTCSYQFDIVARKFNISCSLSCVCGRPDALDSATHSRSTASVGSISRLFL